MPFSSSLQSPRGANPPSNVVNQEMNQVLLAARFWALRTRARAAPQAPASQRWAVPWTHASLLGTGGASILSPHLCGLVPHLTFSLKQDMPWNEPTL